MVTRLAKLVIGFAVFLTPLATAQAIADTTETKECRATVFGTWDAGGGTQVAIIDCGDDTPCGTITELSDPDLRDGNNRDSSLRSRSLIGIQMLSGFRQSRKGWRGGRIYNPANGKTYRSSIRLETNNQLLVKGCVGPFCEGQTWDRVSRDTCLESN